MKNKRRIRAIITLLLIMVLIVCAIFLHNKRQREKENESKIYYGQDGQIDNLSSVNLYDYKGKTNGKSLFLLKDIDFDFMNALKIPGMPDTKSDDFLSNIIYSESQCPQGLCITEDFVLVTSYSEDSECLGEILVFEKNTGAYLFTLGMDPKSHLGGIAYDGKNIWVCNSAEGVLERLSYDFIKNISLKNQGEDVDATGVVDKYKVSNTPSCITFYGDRLWIASHNLFFKSKLVAYHYDTSKDTLKKLNNYVIPGKVQGIAFDDSGQVYLSRSYGRQSSSYINIYQSVVSMSTNPNLSDVKIEMPPCSEEIDYVSDEKSLYVIFESAGEKYIEGTDGKGRSSSPIDKILRIKDVNSFSK